MSNGIPCDVDGSDEFGLTKRLFEHDCVRSTLPNPSSIPGHENVRERPLTQYLLDGRNAASSSQAGIDDHQVGLMPASRSHRIGFSGRGCAHLMAHCCEDLGKQHGDQRIVFDNKHAKRVHGFSMHE